MLEIIRDLIAYNKFEEVFKLLKEYSSDNDFKNTLIGFQRQYNALKDEVRKGLISEDRKDLKSAKLTHNILDWFSDISENNLFFPIGEVEKLISGDESNFLDISFLENALKASKSVCNIEVSLENGKKGYGSGFLTESGYIYTNHHVIKNLRDVQNAKIYFNFENSESGYVSRYRLPSYPLSIVGFKTGDKVLDYSYVKVNFDKDSLIRKFLSVKFAKELPQVGEKVYIIGHPNGGEKKIVLTNNEIVKIDEPYIYYKADTQKGSSGSPVFNENFEVIAIHHKADITSNRGILIKSII